jgi:hypothetical protein
VQRNSASFPQLVETHFGRLERFTADRVVQLVYQRYYPDILKAFEAEHGAIRKDIFCSSIQGAAVLTAKDEIQIVFTSGMPGAGEIEELLFRCDALHVEASRVLKGQDCSALMEKIMGPVSYLLGILERMAVEAAAPQETDLSRPLTLMKNELDAAERFYIRSAQRDAQLNYFFGMMRGFGWLAVGAAVLGLVLFLTSTSASGLGTLVGSILAGAVGAVVSVMSRMSFGHLKLNYEAGGKFPDCWGRSGPSWGRFLALPSTSLWRANSSL